MESFRLPPGKAPTLGDVARLAQVSVSTAARVLRDPDTLVAPDLVVRVRHAASELHYVPNVLARSLRGGVPTMVGLVVGDMLDPYYGTIAETVTEAAESEHSMVAIVSNMQRSAELELKQCQQLWEHRVSGLILAGGGFDQWTRFDEFETTISQIARSGVSVVSLSPRGIDVPTFCVDNSTVGELMATALISQGHRRIGILMGPKKNEVTQLRTRAAVEVIEKAGGTYVLEHAEYTPEAGAESVARVLEESPDITAFVVGTDAMAVGVIAGLQQRGYSVPHDVSVVSAGHTRAASWSTPSLTTVDLRLAECARAALDYIAASVRRKGGVAEESSRSVMRPLTPKLVTGGSVAPVPVVSSR